LSLFGECTGENLTLVCLCLATMGVYRLLVRQATMARRGSQARLCRLCEDKVENKDHHCVWLGVCISSANHAMFLLFLFLLVPSSLHLSLLLTSAACPGSLLGPILLPRVCWPYSDNSKLLLVGGLYSCMVSVLVFILLLEQFSRPVRTWLWRWSGRGRKLREVTQH